MAALPGSVQSRSVWVCRAASRYGSKRPLLANLAWIQKGRKGLDFNLQNSTQTPKFQFNTVCIWKSVLDKHKPQQAGKTLFFKSHINVQVQLSASLLVVLQACSHWAYFSVSLWTCRAGINPLTERQQSCMASLVEHNFKHESHWFLRWQTVRSKHN